MVSKGLFHFWSARSGNQSNQKPTRIQRKHYRKHVLKIGYYHTMVPQPTKLVTAALKRALVLRIEQIVKRTIWVSQYKRKTVPELTERLASKDWWTNDSWRAYETAALVFTPAPLCKLEIYPKLRKGIMIHMLARQPSFVRQRKEKSQPAFVDAINYVIGNWFDFCKYMGPFAKGTI